MRWSISDRYLIFITKLGSKKNSNLYLHLIGFKQIVISNNFELILFKKVKFFNNDVFLYCVL